MRPENHHLRKLPANVILSLSLMLAGCAAGPDYEGAPAIELGTVQVNQSPQIGDTLALDRWWERLGDETLARLVNEAIEHNQDMRIAIIRIEEARARLDSTTAARLPTLDASGSLNVQQQSLNGQVPAINGRDQVIHNTGLSASWEPDLFGRVKRAVESASANIEATAADAESMKLTISTEVARAYFQLRATQLMIKAHEQSVLANALMVDIATKRLALGDIPASEVDLARLRLQNVRAGLPEIEASLHSVSLALGTLTGGLPEKEHPLESTSAWQIDWPSLPVGERVDLIARRPDIYAAERRLAMASANTGLAIAERFPRLVIGANGGFEALHLSDLFKESSQAFSLIPVLSWRIFDSGRVEAQIQAADAQQRIAALNYEKTVLVALAEVERALFNYQKSHTALMMRKEASLRAEAIFETTRKRFATGDVPRLDVLDAVLQYTEAMESEASVAGQTADALMLAIRSLGGGWVRPEAIVQYPFVGKSGNLWSADKTGR